MSHHCFVAEVTETRAIPKADNIQIAIVLGTPVIVGKDIQEGFLGILFPEGLQLSEEFCYENNLHRHSHLNIDQDKTGFFEDSRRVRAQPFLKVKSEGLFVPLEHLQYTDYDVSKLKKGDSFKELNGHELCKKYISPQTQKALDGKQKVGQQKKCKAVESKMISEHMDTRQFRHYANLIPKGAALSFHHKVHGTSGRYSYSKVTRYPFAEWKNNFARNFSWLPRWANKNILALLFKIPDRWLWKEGYEYLVGTRRVILFENDNEKEGYHGSEQFRFDVMNLVLKPYLTKGMTIYGEIAGYANGSPIMAKHNSKVLKDKKVLKRFGEEIIYKYGCTEEQHRFIVYRISITTEDGIERDYSVDQLAKWCEERDIEHTMEALAPMVHDGDAGTLSAIMENLAERATSMCEDPYDSSHPYEGVVLRVDSGNLKPSFYKQKSYLFKCLEGICEEVDIEDSN